MVKFTDASGKTTNLDREGFMALMKALWDASHSTDSDKREEVEGDA